MRQTARIAHTSHQVNDMSSTSTVSVLAQRTSRKGGKSLTRVAFAAVATLGILLASANTAEGQASPGQRGAWEFRVSSGGLVPTGAHRAAIKDAQSTAAR
jgi:hypothetical protein